MTCKRNLPLGWSEWKNCELCRLIKGRMKLPYSLEPVNVIGDNKRKRVKKVNINIFVNPFPPSGVEFDPTRDKELFPSLEGQTLLK